MFFKRALLLLIVVLWAAPLAAQTNTPTDTPTQTPTTTLTSSATATATVTSTATRTVALTKTPLSEATNTRTHTPTRTSTTQPNTPTLAANTPSRTATRTATATATRTPINQSVSSSSAGCLQLTFEPQAIGQPGHRRGLSFWAWGAEMWCGYNEATLSIVAGPDSGAHYSDGQGLSRCACQDADLFCIGSGLVCWDQCADVTPTATATATITP